MISGAHMPFVEVERGSLHYREWGAGPLTIFVHGFGSDHRLWDDLQAHIADRRCVALDLRGWGGSTPVPAGSTSMEAFADDLAQAVAGLGADAADIVGFSMGGFTALALWERHPAVVRSLALVSARANADSEDQRAGRDRLIALALEHGREHVASAFVPSTTSENADSIVTARLRTMMEDQPYETIVASLRGMRDRDDRMAGLATLTVSTLVVVGEEDPLVPADLAKAMAAQAPAARLTVLPGVGHTSPLEAPADLATALRAFWA